MKRRDITLGEMQDQCIKMHRHCERFENKPECPFKEVCEGLHGKGYAKTPLAWNLTDPPRFNEAQMALLKAFKGVGAERVRVTVYGDSIRTFDLIDRFGNGMSFNAILGIVRDETLDLAELLGKDGESK